MSDPYSPERRARDLTLLKHPSRWPNNPIFLKRWDGRNMEHATLSYRGDSYGGRYDFRPEGSGVVRWGDEELCVELVREGWVLD